MSKNILLSGATGFIGTPLVHHLSQMGWQIHLLSRNQKKTAELFPQAHVYAKYSEIPEVEFKAFINLAGAGIADKKWTETQKNILLQSRIQSTKEMVQFALSLKEKPEVMLQGSAIGYYGFSLLDEFAETAPAAPDFLGQLAHSWEETAKPVEQAGIRLCFLRTSLVLGPKGGALNHMLPPFKMGVGGRLGDGKQWMSWIHLTDEIGAILHLLNNPECKGAFNLSAPEVVTNQEFTKKLAQALHRPAFFPVPSFVLKILFGELSCLLLQGQRTSCRKLLESGYQFQYPELSAALGQILNENTD